MKFGAHYLPTYVPDLDGAAPEFYRRMFAQMEELDRLGFDHLWVTEHHFGEYGGSLPPPPPFFSGGGAGTPRLPLRVAAYMLTRHTTLGRGTTSTPTCAIFSTPPLLCRC